MVFIKVLVAAVALAAGSDVRAESGRVKLSGGSFTLGGEGHAEDEMPKAIVTVSSFSIDRTEVSVAQYDSCVTAKRCTPAHYSDGKCLMLTSGSLTSVVVPHQYVLKNVPVTCVDWQQASAYCAYRNGRLPTEAQWEYAALGSNSGTYSWGNTPPSQARCAQSSVHHPSPCGSYSSNSNGLFDMTGNVWEWTQDRYQKDLYATASPNNPQGPQVGRYRSIRGGGWYSNADQLRIKKRAFFAPECGEVSIGFRCVQ